MQKKKRSSSLFSIVVLMVSLIAVSGWAGFKRINELNPGDPVTVKFFRLDNGWTVYITENHEEPCFCAEISVRAGSEYDPSHFSHLAHYLENMLFKGQQSFGRLDYENE